MSKTQQQFYDEIYNPGKEGLDKLHQEKKKNNDQTYQQIQQAIDEQAATSAGVYEKKKAQAPAEYQQYYDENAINEAFTRKQVAESMANMGAVNSGLNESSQVAISLQRNNADAAVQKKQREYVQNLQSAIDQIYTAAATEKKTKKAAMDTKLQEWYDSALLDLENSSREAAATAWGAQEERAAKEYEATLKALQEQAAADNERLDTINKNRENYALKMMSTMGYSEDQAWAAAYAQYPDEKATYYNVYHNALKSGFDENYAKAMATAAEAGKDPEDVAAKMKAKSYIGSKNVLQGAGGGLLDNTTINLANVKSWMEGKGIQGAATTLANLVTKTLKKDENYRRASAKEKAYLEAYAIGNTAKHYFIDDVLTAKYGKHQPMDVLEALSPYFGNDKENIQIDVIREILGLSA